MVSILTTQLLTITLSSKKPTNSPPRHFNKSQQLNIRFSFSLNSTNRNRTVPNSRPLLPALIHSSSISTQQQQQQQQQQTETKPNPLSFRDICQPHVPDHILHRVEEVGYVVPTDVQREALPILFDGHDCILHAQTGSGKTLTYLLLILSLVNPQRSTLQALIVVPTRELGMQVTKVARMLAGKPELEQKSYTVMALLDGGMLRRHKSWLKAEPPKIVVATIGCLCQMLERNVFKLESMRVLVIDEVDFMFNSSKQVSSVRKLLTSYSSCNNRQTVFASASIPQHNRFVYDCIQQKWTKRDVVHVHFNPVKPMPSCLVHKHVVCGKERKHQILLSLLQSDAPESAIIFVNEQSEKSKKAGNAPSTTLLIDFLKTSYEGSLEILLLEEDMNFNSRAASLLEIREGGGYLLVSTEIAARGIDLPETTHIYNFDVPRTAVNYIHRAGRTGRKPFSDDKCTVTNVVISEELFVLKRHENELMFNCEEIFL
ncbi:DEAD domain-containing protein/Helicase_C domain-containing protein [Cephalotus follicularis]|uniref:RNA helicase n=1 Tax=Cephalotus follicularis TaxID=3775 RepID=A0A1Q3CWJ0_CEPFO|nr:DEAD domain-containing protein/Helicase_C domain-containing protein [Cephalotus follicularis]